MIDHIHLLPPEVSLHLFSFLEPAHLMQARAVCSKWKILSEDLPLWRVHLAQIGFAGPYQGIPAYWHSKKVDRLLLSQSVPTLSLNGIPNTVVSYAIDGRELFLASGKEIQIRNLENYQIDAVLKQETAKIYKLFLTADHLITFSYRDNSLNIWDRHRQQFLHSLALSDRGLFYLQVTQAQIFASFMDGTVKIWNIEGAQLVHELSVSTEDRDEIKMSILEETLITFSDFSVIQFWDINSGELLKKEDIGAKIISCAASDRFLIATAEDRAIRLWDIESQQLLATIDSQEAFGKILFVSSDQMIVSTADHCLQVWSLAKQQLLKTLRGPDQEIKEVAVLGNKLLCQTIEGGIYIWELSSGELLQTLPELREEGATPVQMAVSADKVMASFIEAYRPEIAPEIHFQNNFRIWDLAIAP